MVGSFLLLIGLVSSYVEDAVADATELLHNGDFQNAARWTTWFCNGCVWYQVDYGGAGNKPAVLT